MTKILIVEDDHLVAIGMQAILREAGYSVEISINGKDAEQLLSNFAYGLVLLDWDLPGLSGLNVLRKLREDNLEVPVIFVTGKLSLEDKELGLDSGADDYLTKPFEPRELLARIRSVMRRGKISENVVRLDQIGLDVKALTLITPDGSISLSHTEVKILELLLKHPSQVFSSAQIFNQIWSSESEANSDTVRVHMHILRRKLALKNCKELVQTVPNAGYRLNRDFKF